MPTQVMCGIKKILQHTTQMCSRTSMWYHMNNNDNNNDIIIIIIII